MLQLKELRVGNYILANKDGNFKTIAVDPAELIIIQRAGQENVMDANYLTIDIHPDLLDQLGFVQDGSEWNHPNFYPTCYFSDNDFFVEFNEYRIAKNYLHQLQNIFFDLTEEELVLK
jgi:hypothetical protein